jgi:hypothetical protein
VHRSRLRLVKARPRARLDGPEVLPSGGAEIRALGVVEEGVETGVILHIVGDVRNGDGILWELEVWPLDLDVDRLAWPRTAAGPAHARQPGQLRARLYSPT